MAKYRVYWEINGRRVSALKFFMKLSAFYAPYEMADIIDSWKSAAEDGFGKVEQRGGDWFSALPWELRQKVYAGYKRKTLKGLIGR